MTDPTKPGAPARALVVVAHPDDVEVNAAGTIAAWVEGGVTVSYLVVTSGDAGGGADADRARLAAVRRREQREAARIVGVGDVRFLAGYSDGTVSVCDELVRDIVRVIRDVRPQRVMMMSPERDWLHIHQGHPDHLAVGEATARAVYPASGNALAFPELLADEQLQPWTARELWIQAHPQPNHAEDVTAKFELKTRALLAHASQFPNREELLAFLRSHHGQNAATMGLPQESLVETFLRVGVQ